MAPSNFYDVLTDDPIGPSDDYLRASDLQRAIDQLNRLQFEAMKLQSMRLYQTNVQTSTMTSSKIVSDKTLQSRQNIQISSPVKKNVSPDDRVSLPGGTDKVFVVDKFQL